MLTLIDLSLKTTFWVASSVYYAGKYLIYGAQKNKDQIEREEIQRKEDMILERLKKVEELEKIILNNFKPSNIVNDWKGNGHGRNDGCNDGNRNNRNNRNNRRKSF